MMKKSIKRIALMLLAAGINLCGVSQAEVVFDYLSAPMVSDELVLCNLLMKADSGNRFDIVLRPTQDGLISSDSSKRIPLDYIIFNNMEEDIYLKYNKESYLYTNLPAGSAVKNVVAKIRDYGTVPAGIYSLSFDVMQMNNMTSTAEYTGTFNFNVVIPVMQSITYDVKEPQINVSSEQAFIKNVRVKSEREHQIYVTSNTDWVLTVRMDDMDLRAGNYYIRVVSASNKAEDILTEFTRIDDGREVILAKGKAGARNEFLSLEYAVEGRDNRIIPTGRFSTGLKFTLKEVKGI